MLVAEQLNYAPSCPEPEMEIAAEEGRRHEPWIASDLRKLGYAVSEGQSCEKCGREGYHVEFPLTCARLIGHLDRVIGWHDEVLFGEFKALSRFRAEQVVRAIDNGPDDFLKEFPEYAFQVAGYHHATGWRCLYVVKSRDTGSLEVRLLDDKYYLPVEWLEAKCEITSKLITDKILPACELEPGNFFREHVCPFRYMSEDAIGVPWTTRDVTVPLTPQQNDELIKLGTEYAEKDAKVTELTARTNEIKAEFEKLVDNDHKYHVIILPNGQLRVTFVSGYSYDTYPKEGLLRKFGSAALTDVKSVTTRKAYVKIEVK